MAKANDHRPPDQAQRDLIIHELDRNILVEAAAGTGKTTSLVARMVNLLREGKCAIDKLAAVTYTRKAAAELRDRFQVELEKAAGSAEGAARERLAAAVARIERCFLGTIHSFCARLLRERPVEAGVDASFQELDEIADYRLRRQAWHQHVAQLMATNDPCLARLDDLGLEIGQLAQAFYKYADYPDVAEWPVPTDSPPDPGPAIDALRAYVRYLKELLPTLPQDPGNDKLMPRMDVVERMVRQVELQRPADLFGILEQCREFDAGDIVQRNWPGGKEQALEELEHWNQFARAYALPFVEAWRRHRYGPVLDAIRPAQQVYDRLRQEAGALNYQDLLLKAASLLQNKPEIRKYFRNRFTHLLVDEFQDTDPIQAEVMLLLTAEDPNEKNWRRCRPRSGALFVVGDPKQSIYRFRRADIVTYSEVRKIIEDNGGLIVSLTANFRSTTEIVAWINQTFAERFPKTPTEFAPAASPLQVGRTADQPGDLAGIHRLMVPGENKDEVLEYEADLLARAIRQGLAERRSVPRSRKEIAQQLESAARPGDFLIVTRNTHNLSLYGRKLQELGIPHQVTGGTALNELEELALLYTCLRAVARPHDSVALLAALRSELFGFSDQAFYAFKRAGGHFSFRAVVPDGLPPADAASFQDAFDRLGRYARWLATLPPAVAFEKVAADLGLFVRACAGPGGDVQAGGLCKALQLVRAAEAEWHAVADLVEYLGQLVERVEKHDAIPVRPPAEAVVRLMNLHKAKGLEAPIVYLADATGESEHPVDLHIDRAGGTVRGYLAIYEPVPGYSKPPLLACPAEWERLVERERKFQEAENDRLLYVAATRAGTRLTIVQRENGNNNNPWQFFEEPLRNHPVHADPGLQVPPQSVPLTIASADVAEANAGIARRWAALCQATYKSEAIKEVALAGKAPAVERVRTPEGEHGTEWGTIIHALLEAAMKRPEADLKNLAHAFLLDQELAPDLVGAAVETVRSVQRSSIWKRAQAARSRLVEIPFQMLARVRENEKGLETIQSGVIDLIFLEAKGWVLVDYKTDAVTAGSLTTLVNHYRPQVEHYAAGWQKLVSQPVQEMGLYFIRLERYVQLAG